MNQIDKGIEGEEAVLSIASTTYLKYWCYPDPKDELGTGKQICDLLILFKDVAIIIEVKNYQFKGNYERYFNNTLKKALSQINGAERKLFKSDTPLTIKHYLKGDTIFDRSKYSRIQRLIVNLSTVPLFYLGGETTNSNSFVHIFNWFAFLKVVQELDTIPDFIQYLETREATFKNKQLIIAHGEEEDWTFETNQEFLKFSSKLNSAQKPFVIISGTELDLLADYLSFNRSFNKHIISKEYNGASVQLDNSWKEYIERKEVLRKKEEDKKSYFFDELIRREILYYDDEQRIKMATELLSLNRFERRIAGANFHSFIDKYHKSLGEYGMARRYGTFGDFAIGYFMHGNGIKFEQVLNMMNVAALGFSHWENYKSKKVLIVGINTGLTQTKFAYNDNVEELTGQEKEDLLHDLKLLNWFTSVEKIVDKWSEYPE
jgi:hypothetical protein